MSEYDDSLSSFIGGGSYGSGSGGGDSSFPQQPPLLGPGPPPPHAGPGRRFAVGQRIEAMVGDKFEQRAEGGVVIDDRAPDGTYTVLFDNGCEFAGVDGSLLAPTVDRVAELEKQLAHLQWRKCQNAAQIRATMERTKRLQERDILKSLDHDRRAEKADWMAAVIEDELSRPLEVTEHYMQRFEEEERTQAAREEASAALHAQGVWRLQEKVLAPRAEHLQRHADRHGAEASEAWRLADELHNKVIQTKHVLLVDYEGVPAEALDDEDRKTMALLHKRVELLSRQHGEAHARASALGAAHGRRVDAVQRSSLSAVRDAHASAQASASASASASAQASAANHCYPAAEGSSEDRHLRLAHAQPSSSPSTSSSSSGSVPPPSASRRSKSRRRSGSAFEEEEKGVGLFGEGGGGPGGGSGSVGLHGSAITVATTVSHAQPQTTPGAASLAWPGGPPPQCPPPPQHPAAAVAAAVAAAGTNSAHAHGSLVVLRHKLEGVPSIRKEMRRLERLPGK